MGARYTGTDNAEDILGGRGNDRVKAAWYIGTQALESTDGAAASVVVLLIWIYYTAQIVLRPQSGRAGAMSRLAAAAGLWSRSWHAPRAGGTRRGHRLARHVASAAPRARPSRSVQVQEDPSPLPPSAVRPRPTARRKAAPSGSNPPNANTSATRTAFGCKPGEFEADDKGYRADDAECSDGQNDIKIDKDFKITSRRKD